MTAPRTISSAALPIAAALIATLCLAGCRAQPAQPQVTIRAHTWRVDLALTPQQCFQGLSGVTNLPAGRGMLFIFPDSALRAFCMRGCYIPLDIAFLDDRLRVVHTATMAVEPDRAGRVVYASQLPAKYALEVPAGALSAAGVAPGDHAAFTGPIPR